MRRMIFYALFLWFYGVLRFRLFCVISEHFSCSFFSLRTDFYGVGRGGDSIYLFLFLLHYIHGVYHGFMGMFHDCSSSGLGLFGGLYHLCHFHCIESSWMY